MRPGAEFVTMSHRAGAPTAAQHSTWQSPVPCLFGGLAAMLGLIAFPLLILACSCWKLSRYLDGQAAGDADGEKGSASGAAGPAMDFQEHVVVIMAGDKRPTFLAKPVTSRAAETELAAAGDGQDQEKKVAVSSQHGGDATGRSRGRDHDAASQSRNHHHCNHGHQSSSTTALHESSQ